MDPTISIPLPPTLLTRLLHPARSFLKLQAASGILLMFCAAVALAWANSPWRDSYTAFWSTPFSVIFGDVLRLEKALVLWVNDGLMAVFFLVVGLEIKREVLAGELNSVKKAALPAAAALGGMVVPAGLFALMNQGQQTISGWGIPMATDIAFALGVLALLGKRAPLSLKIFLTAIAIVDDLGAVLVIALFYTSQIHWGMLVFSLVCWVLALMFGRAGGRHPVVFILLGVCMWVCMLKSGIHATIAGVLMSLAVPATRFEHERVSPLVRWEHALHPWVAFIIMPVFALANAGVLLGSGFTQALTSPAALGVILGLVVGKPVGIFLFAWFTVRQGWATLPTGMKWKEVFATGLLAGIGFTMSLFVAELAYPANDALLNTAKAGVLTASLVAGVTGYLFLAMSARTTVPTESGEN